MTNKPHKKKKRFKFKKFFAFLITLSLIIFFIYSVFAYKIKNIYVTGNDLYTDYEIIKIAKLNNYPSFIMTSSIMTELKLKNSKLIKSATVSKQLWGTVNIKINEYQPYFITTEDVVVLEDNVQIKLEDLDINLDIPVLNSSLKKSLLAELVESFADIKPTIITKISEITYKPSALDDERFLFLMTDGNYAYVTLNNIENINYYNKIVTKLEGKKGIINFDSYRETDAGITIDIIQ